jgi:hypothetical protein
MMIAISVKAVVVVLDGGAQQHTRCFLGFFSAKASVGGSGSRSTHRNVGRRKELVPVMGTHRELADDVSGIFFPNTPPPTRHARTHTHTRRRHCGCGRVSSGGSAFRHGAANDDNDDDDDDNDDNGDGDGDDER